MTKLCATPEMLAAREHARLKAEKTAEVAQLIDARTTLTNQERVDQPMTIEEAKLIAAWSNDRTYIFFAVYRLMDEAQNLGGDTDVGRKLWSEVGVLMQDVIAPEHLGYHTLLRFSQQAPFREMNAWARRQAAKRDPKRVKAVPQGEVITIFKGGAEAVAEPDLGDALPTPAMSEAELVRRLQS